MAFADSETAPSERKAAGAYGWVIVGVAFVAALTEVSFYNPVLGVFVRPLQEEFGWDRLTISLAVTMGNVGGALVSPLAGAFLDRRGARLPISGGALVMGGSLIAIAFTQALGWFYIFYLLGRATAIGVIDLAVAVAVSNWFIRRRGVAMGIALLGNRAGMALLPLLVQLVVVWAGWRQAWFALGVLVLAATVFPALRYLRRRPEDLGLLPDGDPREGVAPEAPAAAAPDTDWTLPQAARTPAFWFVTLATSHVFLISGAVNLHQMPHLEDKGLSATLAVGVVAAFAVFGGVGGLVAGVLRDRVGSRWTMALSLITSASGIVLLIYATNPFLAYLYGVWYGLSFGVMVTMMGVIHADYFGRTALGRIRGFVAPVNIAFNAAGPPLAGWAFDVSGSYVPVFWAFAALLLLAFLWMLLASPPKARVTAASV